MDPRETLQGHYPVVRTETARFGRRIDVSGGLRIFGSVVFEATIRWLRISETKVHAIAEDGTHLRTYDGATDFYGLLHSTLDTPCRVEQMCRLFSVNTHSPIRIEARLRVLDNPVVYAYDDRGTPTYQKIPLDWRYADDPGFLNAGNPPFIDVRSNWIAPKTIVDQPLWSSRDLTASAHQTTHDEAIAAALQGLPTELAESVRESLRTEALKRLARAA